jgi:hypothetical protein
VSKDERSTSEARRTTRTKEPRRAPDNADGGAEERPLLIPAMLLRSGVRWAKMRWIKDHDHK